jgi:hypothetical protein
MASNTSPSRDERGSRSREDTETHGQGTAPQLSGMNTQPLLPGGYAIACEAFTSTRTASVSSAFSSANGAVVFTE